MSDKVIQSVILNYNENFASNLPFNNLVPVAQELNIGPNAEIAVYGGTLARAPIVITSNVNADITLKVEDGLPNSFQLSSEKVEEGVYIQQGMADAGEIIKIQLSAGSYSRDSLCNNILVEANNRIANDINDKNLVILNDPAQANFQINSTDVKNNYSYYMDYDENDFFLGLRRGKQNLVETLNGPANQQVWLGGGNNSETRNIGVKIFADTAGTPATLGVYGSNASVQTDSWTQFLRAETAIMPCCMKNPDIPNPIYQGEESYYSFQVDIGRAGGDVKKQMLVGFINTLFQSEWTDSNIPELTTFPVNDLGEIPNVYLGANFIQTTVAGEITESYIDLVMPMSLNSQIDEFQYLDNIGQASAPFNGSNQMMRLAKIPIPENIPPNPDTQPSISGKYKFNFYYEVYNQNQNRFELYSTEDVKPNRIYFFQFSVEGRDGYTVLYDSKKNGVHINANWIDDGALFECVESQRDDNELVSTGFMPIVFFRNTHETDFLRNPSGNFVLLYDEQNTEFRAKQIVTEYSFFSDNKDISNILGIPKGNTNPFPSIVQPITIDTVEFQPPNYGLKNLYDPNAYPLSRKLGGLVKLFSDNVRYNIELNLALKAFNSTEGDANNIAQKRAIIFNQDPFVEGETTLINSNSIYKNIEPNTIKWLTLNNNVALGINNLRLEIRRSKTNVLAREILDSEVEILIKSDIK
tara:strand:- start:1234 stop:3321 length:2088 start_codon:yes stop_codon:yes gene_type:complete